jgi:hypothetical protein
VTPPAAPSALTVPSSGTYGTYSISVTTAFGTETTTVPFALTLALGSVGAGDISPSASYPFYTGSAATPLYYAQVTATAPVTFLQTPQITVTAASFPSGNTCSLFLYTNNTGTGYTWNQVPGASGTAIGTTVTIPSVALPSGQTVNVQAGSATPVFVGCH